MNAYDVTIIGAGPVGLYAAFYASLRRLKVKLIDALPEVGGQLQALYPEKYIYDIPGFPEIKAKDLIKNLHNQLSTVDDNIEIALNERVEYVRRQEETNLLEICTDQNCHYSKTIIITAGNGAFQPRTLGIENEETYENIHYFVNNMDQFKEKKVAIFGGGDSAVDWANMLDGVAEEVHVIHRRDQFRAKPFSVQKMLESSAIIHTPYVIDGVESNGNVIQKINIKNKDEVKTIEVDDVIVLFGFLSALGPIETWDLTLENKALVVNQKQATNIPGIFAAGDACTYDGKLKIITCGFGEATVAVNECFRHVHPEKRNAPVFSSVLKARK